MSQLSRFFKNYYFSFFFKVKEKLTADPDSEIATTSLRVSLMCPVSKAIKYSGMYYKELAYAIMGTG